MNPSSDQLFKRNVSSREKTDSICGRFDSSVSPRVILRKTSSSPTNTNAPAPTDMAATRMPSDTGRL